MYLKKHFFILLIFSTVLFGNDLNVSNTVVGYFDKLKVASGFKMDKDSKLPLKGKSLLITINSYELEKMRLISDLAISASEKGADVNIFITSFCMKKMLEKNDSMTNKAMKILRKDVFVDYYATLKIFEEFNGKIYVDENIKLISNNFNNDFFKEFSPISMDEYWNLLFFKSDKNLEF